MKPSPDIDRYADMFADMFDALDAGRPPRETLADGYVVNAIVDAIYAHTGVKHIDMPVTPEKVWRILNDA